MNERAEPRDVALHFIALAEVLRLCIPGCTCRYFVERIL